MGLFLQMDGCFAIFSKSPASVLLTQPEEREGEMSKLTSEAGCVMLPGTTREVDSLSFSLLHLAFSFANWKTITFLSQDFSEHDDAMGYYNNVFPMLFLHKLVILFFILHTAPFRKNSPAILSPWKRLDSTQKMGVLECSLFMEGKRGICAMINPSEHLQYYLLPLASVENHFMLEIEKSGLSTWLVQQ